MEEYITDKEFCVLLEEIVYKIENGKDDECREMLSQIITDANKGERYIDRTYIGSVKTKKRLNRIGEINGMLEKMSVEQVENIYQYTVDEYNEPNHAAEALDAIVRLSRKEE